MITFIAERAKGIAVSAGIGVRTVAGVDTACTPMLAVVAFMTAAPQDEDQA